MVFSYTFSIQTFKGDTVKRTDNTPFIQADFVEKVSENKEKALSRDAYQRAIRALDLDTEEESFFMDPDNLDLFRSQLIKRLKKTKLWNYPPEKRDAAKSARTRLQNFLGVEVLY